MTSLDAWLDVRWRVVTLTDLFGERRTRVVQFRYVSDRGRWHLGRFGDRVEPLDYAPFRHARSWRTKPQRGYRPILSACETSDTVNHDYPSRIAVAQADNRPRICVPCLDRLFELRAELAVICEFDPPEFDELAEHVCEFGDDHHQAIVCLANAFDGIQQE